MKKTKVTALALTTLMGTTTILNGVPPTVFAQENTDMIIESPMLNKDGAKNEVNLTEPNNGQTQDIVKNDVKSKKIYIQTLASEGGNGSEEKPFNDFKTAYKYARENDTLVLLNNVTIQNDDNFSDQGVFTFNKAIKIEGGNAGNGALTSRVSVQLGANIKFENVEFVAKKIYLNGHTLEMSNVKNNKNNPVKPSVYGGSYQNVTTNKGAKSVLRVDGYVGDAFKFKTIYAGSETGESDIPVTLDLIKGVNIEDGIYASGLNGKVNADVEFKIGQISVDKFENNYATSNATIIFNGYDKTDGPVLKGFNDVTLKNSRIKVKNLTEFLNIKGKLELDSKSKLDISNVTTPLSVGSFVGEEGSQLMLNKTGKLEVKGELTGTVELRTPGFDIATSGVVEKDHVYISAAQTSSGNVTFKPFFNQQNLELKKEDGQIKKEWVIRSKKLDNPIEKLDIIEDKKMKIEKDTEQEFTLKYSDEYGNSLQYEPQFEFTIKDPTGKNVGDNEVEIVNGDTSEQMLVYIYDDTLETGVYTIVITEVVSGKIFEIPFTFYKDNQQTSYTVEFNANGGSGNMISQSIELNTSTKLSKNTFTRNGYTFKGWSKQPNGNVEYTDEQEIQNLTNIAGEKIVLYAIWSKDWLNINTVPTINATDKVLTVGDEFNPLEGVTASDKEDGDLTENIEVIENNVDTKVAGTYSVTYSITDSQGATSSKTIEVMVKPNSNIAPVINGVEDITIKAGDKFNPIRGVTATDEEDGNLTSEIEVTGTVDTSKPGEYKIVYSVTDSKGKTTKVTRIVTVQENIFEVESNFREAYWEDEKLVFGGTFDLLNTNLDKDLEKTLLIKDSTENVVKKINTWNASWNGNTGYQCFINKSDLEKLNNGEYKLFVSAELLGSKYEVAIKQPSLSLRYIVHNNINKLESQILGESVIKFSSNSDNDVIFSKSGLNNLTPIANVSIMYFNNSNLVVDGNLGFNGLELKEPLNTKLTIKDSSGNIVDTLGTWSASWGEKNTGFQGIINNDILTKLNKGIYTLYATANFNGTDYETKLVTNADFNVDNIINDFKISVKANSESITLEKILDIKYDSSSEIKQSYWDGDNFVINGFVNIGNKNLAQSDVKKLIIKDSYGNKVDEVSTTPTDWFVDKGNFSGFQAIIPKSIVKKLNIGTYSLVVQTIYNDVEYTAALKQTPSVLRALNIQKDINKTESKLFNGLIYKFATDTDNSVILNVTENILKTESKANNIYWDNAYVINGGVYIDDKAINVVDDNHSIVIKDSTGKVIAESDDVYAGWNEENPYQAILTKGVIDNLNPGTYTIAIRVTKDNSVYDAPIKLTNSSTMDTREYTTNRYTVNLRLNSNKEVNITIK